MLKESLIGKHVPHKMIPIRIMVDSKLEYLYLWVETRPKQKIISKAYVINGGNNQSLLYNLFANYYSDRFRKCQYYNNKILNHRYCQYTKSICMCSSLKILFKNFN